MSDEAEQSDTRRAALSQLLEAERRARAASEQTERWLEPLRRAARDAVTTVSLDEVLRGALEAIAAALDGDAASVLLASDDRSELSSRAAVGLNKDIDLDVHVPKGKGYAGTILETREPYIVADMHEVTVISPTLRESGLRSLVGVPLVGGDDVVGVMHVGSTKVGHFTAADAEMLELLAEPIAAAILRVQLFERERNARLEAEGALTRLASLQNITAELANATSVIDVCRVILHETRTQFPDSDGGASIWVLRDGRLVLLAGTERARRYPEIPLTEQFPPLAHLGSGEPLFVETFEELTARWPVLSEAGVSAFAGLPLRVEGDTIGLMALAYLAEHPFTALDRAFLVAVAEQAAVALDRARAREREAREQELRGFVAEASLALSSPYAEPQQLLQRLTDLVVPRLADWSAVVLVQGTEMRRVAFSGRPSVTPRALELSEELASSVSGPSVSARVIRTGQPVLATRAELEAQNRSLASLADELGTTSVMVVPLVVHGRTLGAMSFGSSGVHPDYGPDDLLVAEEIASRAAIAAEDAMERSRDRALAAMLTRALLPSRFPELPDVEFAARYTPADAGPVGGDWYDVFELQGGRLGLAVGDVSGHGVEAASMMARLRMGLVAYATEGHPAPAIFERLAALLAEPGDGFETAVLATLTYALYDREQRRLDVSCAGHLPYVLLRDRAAELIECGGRALVPGLPSETKETALDLEGGDTLLFLTDGLVERHDEPVDIGLQRLLEAARDSGRLDLETLCDEVLERTMPAGGRRDDCCLLAVRVH